MSIFNKGLRAFSSAPSFFNKSAGFARSIFNKAPSALRGISGGLGQASRALGSAASQGDRLLSDPAVQGLARQASNPSSYSGQSPAQAASSAIERAKSLGGQAKNLFV